MTGVREPGAILLVGCYELGHQPLAVAWPAAFLERAGYRPAVLDVSIEPFDAERVRRARLVAISVPMHTALRLGVGVAARVRQEHPSAHICFYGLYATLNAEHLLRHSADSVMSGEVEDALVELARHLEAAADRGPVGPRAASAPILTKLDFPAPSRSLLPSLKKYAHLERGDGRLELAGYVEASRGCKHHCRHCPIPPVYGGRFFVVDRAVVMADVRQLVDAGATHITFGDPDFLNGPGHASKLVQGLHAEFPALTYDFTAKIEHIVRHRELFPEFAATGCVFVVSAVESLSPVVLANLEKGHTRADVQVALEVLRRAGIALRPAFVPFTPWATIGDFLELLEWVAAEGLVDQIDPVQFTIRLLIPPGSLLLSRPGIQPFLDGLDAARFTYRWAHPDPRMDSLQREVSALAEQAARRDEDPAVTFGRIRMLAYARAGRGEAISRFRTPPPERPIPARLTEPWFC